MVAVLCVGVLCLLYRFVDGTWIDLDVAVISVQTLAIDPMTYSIDYRDKLYLRVQERKMRSVSAMMVVIQFDHWSYYV